LVAVKKKFGPVAWEAINSPYSNSLKKEWANKTCLPLKAQSVEI